MLIRTDAQLALFLCLLLVLLRRDVDLYLLKIRFPDIKDGYVLDALRILTLDAYPWLSVLLVAHVYDTYCLVTLFNDCQDVNTYAIYPG